MGCDEGRIVDYLGGTLHIAQAEQVDAHLLACDACWAAVQDDRRGRDLAHGAREPAPPGLADRIRVAINLEDLPPPARSPRRTVALALAAVVAAIVAFGAVSTAPHATDDDVIAAARIAAGDPAVEVTRTAVAGTPVAIAVGDDPFPMPPGAERIPGATAAWTSRQGALTVVCIDEPEPRLIVGALSAAQLLDAVR